MNQQRPLRKITKVEVEAALKGMKKGKAAGPSGLTSELLQAAGKLGIKKKESKKRDEDKRMET